MFGTIVNIFESCLVSWFLYSLCTDHKKYALLYMALTAVLNFLAINYINQFLTSQSLMFILFTGLYYIFEKKSTDCSSAQCLFIASLPLLIIMVTNITIDLTLMAFVFPGESFYDVLEMYQIPFDIIIQLIHVIEFYLIVRFLHIRALPFTESEWYIASLLSIISVVITCCFESVYLEFETQKYFLIFGMYSVFLFIVLILLLFRHIYLRADSQTHSAYEIEILKAQAENNQKILDAQKDVHQIRHDIKHLVSLLKDQETNNPEIKDFTSQYEHSLGKTFVPIVTISPAINHVLNIKCQEAMEKHIDIVCAVNIQRVPDMDDMDLSLLLANMLDNAIIHIGIEKSIHVMIREQADMMMVQVANSVNGPVLDQNGNFMNHSSSEGHGYGLKTIELVLKKYDGEFLKQQRGDEIVCTAFIPYKN